MAKFPAYEPVTIPILKRIGQQDILPQEIKNRNIADLSITTAKIVDASITTAKIVDASITTVKIVDAAITNAKIASLAADKITAGNITVAVGIGSGEGGAHIKIDATNNRITINDGSNDRVYLGSI